MKRLLLRLVRPLLWLVGLAGLAAALGLQILPATHVATRQGREGDVESIKRAKPAIICSIGWEGPPTSRTGIGIGLRFWHTWTMAPGRQIRLYGPGARRPLRLANGSTVNATIQLELDEPLPPTPDPVLQRAAAIPSATLNDLFAKGKYALEPALEASLSKHPSIDRAHVRVLAVSPGQGTPGALPQGLQARMTQMGAALKAAQAAANDAAGQAATATERARAQATLEAAKLKSDAERALATIQAAAARDVYTTRAAADAAHARLVAEGELAHAQAMAEVERLTADALSGEGGRWLLAVQAARNFKLPPNMTLTPESLQAMGSVAAWKRYFAGGLAPHLKSKRGIDRSEN